LEATDIISSGLLEQYALGITSPEENLLVQDALKKYPEVRKELTEIESSLEDYAASYAMKPSADVKTKILSQIKKTAEPIVATEVKGRKLAAVYKMNNILKIAVAACLLAFIFSLYYSYTYYNKYKSINEELVAKNEELKTEKEKAFNLNNDLGLIKDKQALPVVLKGTPHSPESAAKIFWMQNTGEVYVDPSNLPAPPDGKQYQLWAIVNGKPVDAGLISAKNGDIYRIQKMKSFGKAQAFAITLEKTGGSPTPTMEEMVVISKM
jgi:anti-sigma-K factor RskA